MGRHHFRRDRNIAGIVLFALLAALVIGGGIWAYGEAQADCLAGRLTGPWC